MVFLYRVLYYNGSLYFLAVIVIIMLILFHSNGQDLLCTVFNSNKVRSAPLYERVCNTVSISIHQSFNKLVRLTYWLGFCI